MRPSFLRFLVLFAIGATACDRNEPVERTATMPAVPFDSVFRLAGTLTPEQPDSAPIGLVSGIDFAEDGSFAIPDVRSSRVNLYDAQGRLRALLGRRGFGPGEFQVPLAPAIDRHGRIHVIDLQQPRITVFNPDGSLLRTIPIPEIGRVGEIEVLEGGDYLLVAWMHGGNDLLIHTDSLGTRISNHLPHARIRPEGQPKLPVWGNVRSASVAAASGRAFVVSSLADSLWTVDLQGSRVSSERITPPGYVPPSAPRENMFDTKAFSRWAESWTNTTLVRASSEGTIVVFVRGVLMRGDSAVAAYRDRKSGWRGLTSAPIVLAMRGDTVVALMDPDADRIALGLYVRR